MADHRILLFSGRGIISQAIRWQTRSQYSHAALYIGNNTIIESWQGGIKPGVREKKLADWTDITSFTIPTATPAQWKAAEEFARSKVGKGYDYWSIVRFVSRQAMPQNDAWFCSELVFAAMKAAGVELLARIDPGEVSPGMLALSPLLHMERVF